MDIRDDAPVRVGSDEQEHLLDFHWGWLNGRPVLWTAAILIAAVGGAYYALVQRHKTAEIMAPEGELMATTTAV